MIKNNQEWGFYVDREPQSDLIKFYLIRSSASGRQWVATFDGTDAEYGNRFFRLDELEIGIEPKPLFVINHLTEQGILLAMAEGLRKAGVEIEVDIKKRVAAQAVADERGKELEYFKELNTMVVKKLVGGND